MLQYTDNLQIKLTKEQKYYLDIISEKYCYKRCDFIRDAIVEKMRKDVPKLRQKYKLKKEYCPF